MFGHLLSHHIDTRRLMVLLTLDAVVGYSFEMLHP